MSDPVTLRKKYQYADEWFHVVARGDTMEVTDRASDNKAVVSPLTTTRDWDFKVSLEGDGYENYLSTAQQALNKACEKLVAARAPRPDPGAQLRDFAKTLDDD